MITYYTTPLHETLVVSSVSSNSDDQNNAIDGKLNTNWTPSAGATWGYVIDTYPQEETAYLAGRGKTSGSIESIGIWIGNYDTDFTGGAISIIQGATATPNVTILSATTMSDADGPLWVKDLTTSSSARYIKVEASGFPVTTPAELNFFFLSKNALTRSHEYRGSTKLPSYDNITVKLRGANDHITVHQKAPVDSYKRMYKLINATEVAWVENVYNESSGRRNLFIINEGTTQVENIVCRFNRDKPKWRDITGDYREATLDFDTIHYIRDNETI